MNACTPCEICTVKYNDLDVAIRQCLQLAHEVNQMEEDTTQDGFKNDKLFEDQQKQNKPIFIGKTDLSSAFRILPLLVSCFCWLVFKALDPRDGKFKYFIDKCLPFGASISCSLYQWFSNALKFILTRRMGVRPGRAITNYLDDFLFSAIAKTICDTMISEFLLLCGKLNIPVAIEKTEWGDTMAIFLGIMLNGRTMTLSIPLAKQEKALKLLNDLAGKKRATVKQLQVLTGYLKFLTKAIVPGRTFTRCMYKKYSNLQGKRLKNGRKLKDYHQVKLDNEFKFNCEIWRTFLTHSQDIAVCRPMIDLGLTKTAQDLFFYSDASANQSLGMGAVYSKQWCCAQ